ncbi:MAG: site-specific integrase [Microthrixaceae bacterium]
MSSIPTSPTPPTPATSVRPARSREPGAPKSSRPSSPRLYPALHLTAYTGMRRGEVGGLKWSDLDRANQRLSISRTIQSIAGQPVEFPVKTRTSRRCIDIDDETMDVLGHWRRRLGRDGLPTDADDWIFLNPAGRFVNPESIAQLFHRIQRGLPDLTRIRFHDLRHTHASLLIMDGVPVKVVSERLGHANVAFTMHIYQHLLPGMSAAAARQFAALLRRMSRSLLKSPRVVVPVFMRRGLRWGQSRVVV